MSDPVASREFSSKVSPEEIKALTTEVLGSSLADGSKIRLLKILNLLESVRRDNDLLVHVLGALLSSLDKEGTTSKSISLAPDVLEGYHKEVTTRKAFPIISYVEPPNVGGCTIGLSWP